MGVSLMDDQDMVKILGVPGDVKDWITRPLAESEIASVHASYAATERQTEGIGNAQNELQLVFAGQLGTLQGKDEVWAFRSPKETWSRQAGREGFCILRGDQVVAIHLTLVS